MRCEAEGLPVENPGTSIVGNEPDSNVVTCLADADNVTFHRVNEVVGGASCAANDAESMLKSIVKPGLGTRADKSKRTPCKCIGC